MEDPRSCRRSGSNSSRFVSLAFGRRAGGARPSYCMIEAESKMLPLISKALASLAKVMPETREEDATTAKKTTRG